MSIPEKGLHLIFFACSLFYDALQRSCCCRVVFVLCSYHLRRWTLLQLLLTWLGTDNSCSESGQNLVSIGTQSVSHPNKVRSRYEAFPAISSRNRWRGSLCCGSLGQKKKPRHLYEQGFKLYYKFMETIRSQIWPAHEYPKLVHRRDQDNLDVLRSPRVIF